MMKRNIYIILLLTCIILNAQEIPPEFFIRDATPEPTLELINKSAQISNCSTSTILSQSERRLFIPKTSSDIVTINVNLIFIQKTDGSGNFQENNAEHNLLWDEIESQLNWRLGNLSDPNDLNCYTGSDFVKDIKFRFDFKRYYHPDDDYYDNGRNWYNPNRSGYHWSLYNDPKYKNYSFDAIHYQNYYNVMDADVCGRPDYRKGINIYFNEHKANLDSLLSGLTDSLKINSTWCSEFPTASDLQANSRIHAPCLFAKMWHTKNLLESTGQHPGKTWESHFRGWLISSTARALFHELGHTFNLAHSADGCYSLNGCYYSVMHMADNPRNYLPPPEIGKMHASVALTNVRQFVQPNYNAASLDINGTFLWNREIQLLQDVRVINGGNLSITCKLNMLKNASMYIEEDGYCLIDNADLKCIDNSDIFNINVEDGGVLTLKDVTMEAYNITVKSGGTLIISDALTLSGESNIVVEEGGYICFDSSADYNLINHNNIISLQTGFLFGVNSAYVSSPPSCQSNTSLLNIIGNGEIKTYGSDLYIQNESITSNKYYTGKNIFLGESVTTSQTQGPVTIVSGSSVVLEAEGEMVVFDKGFELENGSELDVKTPKNHTYGKSLNNPIDIGNVAPGNTYIKTVTNSGMGNNYSGTYNQNSPDVFFKFELNTTRNVLIQLCDSEIEDGYVHLLNSVGTHIISMDDDENNDYCDESLMPYLETTLSSGIYYIVVEGYGNNEGNITMSLEVN